MGRDGDLHNLLRHQSLDGRNFWYEAKALTGNLSGYLADIELAWHLAEISDQKSFQGSDISLLTHQLQYALMQSSARAATRVLNVRLLIALLNTGVWTTNVALDQCRQIVDRELRVKCLLEIRGRMPHDRAKEHLVLEALDTAKLIDVPHIRNRSLLSLVPHLTADAKIAVIKELLEVAAVPSDSHSSREILTGLSVYLVEHPELVKQAMEITWRDQNTAGRIRNRVESFARFAATHFGDTGEELRHVETSARGEAAWEFATSLAALSHCIREQQYILLSKAAEIACKIENPFYRAAAIIDLVQRVDAFPRLLRRLLAAARSMTSHGDKAKALAAFLPKLKPRMRSRVFHETLAAAGARTDAYGKLEGAEILGIILPYTPPRRRFELLSEAVELVRDARLAHLNQCIPLITLAPHLTTHPDLLKRAIDELEPEGISGSWVVPVLEAMVPALQANRGMVSRALQIAQSLPEMNDRAGAVAVLAPLLNPVEGRNYLVGVLKDSSRIQDDLACANAFEKLPRHCANDLDLLETLRVFALSIKEDGCQVKALAALIPYVPIQVQPDLTDYALRVARQDQAGLSFAYSVAALAPYIEDHALPRVLVEAMESTIRIGSMGLGPIFTDAIAALAPHFLRCPNISHDALNLIAQLPEKDLLGSNTCAFAMSVLVPYLPAASQAAICEHLLDVAGQLEEMSPFRNSSAAQLLANVARHLSNQSLVKALNLARNMKDVWARVATLVTLLPSLALSGTHLPEAFSLLADLPQTSSIGGSPYAELLGRMIPFLAGHSELSSRAEEAMMVVKDEHQRFFVRLALMGIVPEDLGQQQATMALPFAMSMRDRQLRCRALATLCPLLPEEMRAPAARAAFQAVLDAASIEARSSALNVVAPCIKYDLELLAPALQACASVTHIEQRPRIMLHVLAGISKQPSDEVLDLALEVACGTDDQRARDQILTVITRFISALPRRQQLSAWRKMLRDIAAYPRSKRLADIGPLANIAVSLGGQTAVAALARSVTMVRTWWP
jgi:hypothetical protein